MVVVDIIAKLTATFVIGYVGLDLIKGLRRRCSGRSSSS